MSADAATSWPAPAKLNLMLHIVGRRSDGYHLLQTVFQFLDYADELYFRVTDDGIIERSGEWANIPADADLTLRAARLLQQVTRCTKGVRITLAKRIPIGGGLGGGSSDAATALLALNQLWDVRLSIEQLAALGLQLGADVPFFLRGRAAVGEGIGDVLTPIDPPERWYAVAVPPVAVPTAEVYAAFARENRLTPLSLPRTIRDLREGYGRNDLEAVVRKRYPAVERAFQYLAPWQPRLTGSGGCVFVNVGDPAEGQRVLAGLPAGFTGFVARGMNRHPLLGSARTQ
ncbi:MAG: 4-(cytidine 5'-diphospho)-2-C-methyl-D-erythritol kinase [Sulfurifustis sp.]